MMHPRSMGHFILELMSLSMPLSASWLVPTLPFHMSLPPLCERSFLKRAFASIESIAP